MSSTSQPVAANVLGTIGTVLWCVQLIPQIWHNWRHKSTTGLPALMMALWALCAFPFGSYAIIQNLNIPVQCQAQIFCTLSIVTWAQCMHYGHGWSTMRTVLVGCVCGIVSGGVEAGLVFAVRPLAPKEGEPRSARFNAAILSIGIVASILIAAGLIPPYFEIFKRRGRVVGINFLFLATDFFGAFFSLLSLAAQHEFDPLGGVLYLICLSLEGGIFLSHWIWLGRKWWRIKRGLSIEELMTERGAETPDLEQGEKHGTITRGTEKTGCELSGDGSAALEETSVGSEGVVEKADAAAANSVPHVGPVT